MTDDRAEAAPGLAEKTRFLSDPAAYPFRPRRVRVVETHMSLVFLAGARVYKLKKPVRAPHLDFSTLAARARFVREEVRINRRLAPGVYLGATPLSVDGGGRLSLGPGGRVVDWLVEMRRLPAARMLDRLILRGRAAPPLIARAADALAAFYAAAPPERPRPEAHLGRFRREMAETAAVLRDPALGLAGGAVERALAAAERAFAAAAPLIAARIAQGRIVEGHGDLRPEHVCLTDPPAIFDALEFDRALRVVDPFDEIALLGLDCERLGAGWVHPILFARLAAALGGAPPPPVLAFYRRYRALLRARLALAHLRDPHPRKPRKWRPLARRYVALSVAADDAALTAAARPAR